MAYKYTVQNTDSGGLNSIAQRFGFKNYKEAGVSAVPSNNFDVIRAGDVIEFNNYDPNKIQTMAENGSPVVSSKDNAQQYGENSKTVDGLLGSLAPDKGATTEKTTETPTDKYVPNATGDKNVDTGKIETTGDPVLDRLNSWEKEQDTKINTNAETKKVEYANLYNTSLSAIDATLQSTLDSINSTFNKRIEEQKKINRINIGRVTAYGLSEGGRYTPIDFNDAISNREVEASDKITELENQRNSLISQAKSARDSGQSKLLSEKLANLEKVDESIRKQFQEVKDEADRQYKLLRDIRQEEETKHANAVAKMLGNLKAIAPSFIDEYEKLDGEAKNKFIQDLQTKTGLDFASIYSTLEGAVITGKNDYLDMEKKKADIESAKALTADRKASTAKTWAEKAKIEKGGTQTDMSKDVPDTFSDADDFAKQKRAFVKKYGEDGNKYWEAIFYDKENEEYSYEINKEAPASTERVTVIAPDGSVGTIPKSQLTEALSKGYKQK